MKASKGYKIVTATLLTLIMTVLLHRLVYSGFAISRVGRSVWYDWDLWKQYWAWLPGKILCLALVLLAAALIIESAVMIFRGGKK